MYKIIGADGKEYGPVTLEQLRQWLAEGRINTQTQIQSAGTTNWKFLGELPEFTNPARGNAGNVPPVVPAPVNAEALAAQILARTYTIQIGSCISRGWALVKANFWLLVGASFVSLLLAGGCGVPYIGPAISLIIGGPMLGGLYALILKKIRGQSATFGDAFVGFSIAFVPLMLAHIVSGSLVMVGFLLLIIPGIYLVIAWQFTLALVIDKKIDFWPAMELSRKVVSQHWWVFFGLLIVSVLIILLGCVCCLVGVFIAIPVGLAAMMYAYEDIFGSKTTPTT